MHCSDSSLSAFSFLGGVRWYIFLGKGVHEEEEKRSSSYLEVTGMPFSQDVQPQHCLPAGEGKALSAERVVFLTPRASDGLTCTL